MAGSVPPGAARPGGDGRIRIAGISQRFGDVRAVDDVSFDIESGELLTLLGPSGSGKTSLLRMIAGLAKPDAGEIWVGGQRIDQLPTHRRNIGMVFQSLALFPHLSVFGNIAFPLWMRRCGKRETAARVREALEVVRLPQIAARRVDEISGGQRQRVALARALVYRPKLLLLDEPFAALDAKLREEMQLEIIRLHHDLGITIVNVTHDQKEALTISDRVAVMSEGRLRQIGTTVEIYQRPNSAFVAGFVGTTNLLHGAVAAGGEILVLADSIRVPLGGDKRLAPGAAAALVLRAERLTLMPAEAIIPADLASLPGMVRLRAFQGNTTLFEVEVVALGRSLRAETTSLSEASRFPVGTAVSLTWRPQDAALVPV
ncbi:ABC transporter ATP-binding protein [Acidisoma cellulosilytica]|uniref:ABC transporter ATP-binding protein n=1 Tax=Acidisoma cellulosilyticum TaxID=2802395 RepID=A0A963Z6B4_9PROT|nr:ABC transporter ATP-binding protein [Acidisoma cellulosilyticum]MCB8883374.1 ABC transporter ATP-binding protein [Acidisoma cellulosilyticum]